MPHFIMVIVLIPTLFVSGIGGSFLQPLFWSMVLALAACPSVGLSVTPVMAQMLLPKGDAAAEGIRLRSSRPVPTTTGHWVPPVPAGLSAWSLLASSGCSALPPDPTRRQQAGCSDAGGPDPAGSVGLHGRHVQ